MTKPVVYADIRPGSPAPFYPTQEAKDANLKSISDAMGQCAYDLQSGLSETPGANEAQLERYRQELALAQARPVTP